MKKSAITIVFIMCGILGIEALAQDNTLENTKSQLMVKADVGDPCSMFSLGTLYLIHPNLSDDGVSEVYKRYIAAAEKGHSQAQSNLCDMYFYGVGAEPNPQLALKWCYSAGLDKNTTDDVKAEQRRIGAIWKADVLKKTYPEYNHEGKIGGMIGHPSTWNCKSVFE